MRDEGCVEDVLVLPQVCKLTDEEDLHIMRNRRCVGETEEVCFAFVLMHLRRYPHTSRFLFDGRCVFLG